MLYSIVGMLVIILDQAVKYWVANTLFGTDIVKFIPGVISLVNVHNDGAAFSFLSGSGARIYFIIVAGVFAVLVVIALATNFVSTPVARWSLVFVTAGALGNMIDRIMYGYVQDMFKVELFNFAIFNVADVFITVFAIVFALAMLFEKPRDDDPDEWEDEEEDEEKAPAEKARKRALSGRKNREEKKPAAIPAAKKSRQEQYEKEYQAYKEQRRAAEKPAPARNPAPAEDPFAAWENANRKADERSGATLAAKAMGTEGRRYTPPQRPVRTPVQQPAQQPAPQPAQRPVQQPAQRPVQQRPVEQSHAAPAKANDDFDLDDILAEFK